MQFDTTKIKSNGFPVSFNGQYENTPECSWGKDSIDDIRKKYQENGVLLIRNFFSRTEILGLRSFYFRKFRKTGLLDEKYKPVHGIYAGEGEHEGYGVKGHPAYSFVRHKVYLQFCHSQRLRKFVSDIMGLPMSILERKIVRHFIPGTSVSSKAHRDSSYFSEGNDVPCLNMWIPFGDCDEKTGFLIYLKNGHKIDVKSLTGKDGIMNNGKWISKEFAKLSELTESPWFISNYNAGDISIHFPDSIHGSTDCNTPDNTMRLTTDIRFVEESKNDPYWMKAWAGDDGF